MNINKARAIISTILMLSGFITFVTGGILYFMEYGMWLWFTRKFLNDAHAVCGVVMGIAIIIHCSSIDICTKWK